MDTPAVRSGAGGCSSPAVKWELWEHHQDQEVNFLLDLLRKTSLYLPWLGLHQPIGDRALGISGANTGTSIVVLQREVESKQG